MFFDSPSLAAIRCISISALRRQHRTQNKAEPNKKCRPKNVWKLFGCISRTIFAYTLDYVRSETRQRIFLCIFSRNLSFHQRRYWIDTYRKRQTCGRVRVCVLGNCRSTSTPWTKFSNLNRFEIYFHSKIDNNNLTMYIHSLLTEIGRRGRAELKLKHALKNRWTCVEMLDICRNCQSIIMVTTAELNGGKQRHCHRQRHHPQPRLVGSAGEWRIFAVPVTVRSPVANWIT